MEATMEKTSETENGVVFGSSEELAKAVWKNDVTLSKKDGSQYVKSWSRDIASEGIVVTDNGNGTMTFTRKNVVPKNAVSHKYVMPDFADEIRCIVRQSIDGNGMANLALFGNAGCGKTEFIYELAREFGVKVYQVNGSEGLTNADFYGTMSVGIDNGTKQNYTYFEKGPLYRAFIEGTKVDNDGNQILDANGEPIVIGKPAFFFLDEFAAMLPEVFLGVFNRAMEIPREHGRGRSIEITMDNGRVVKSHPGMVMFLAGNTVGTGNNGRYQMGFTAQGNKMDESTRNRITAFYRFGYSKNAEKSVALGMLNDDYEVSRLMKFRDNVRNMFRQEKVETLFTTRSIVAACEVAVNFRKNGMNDWMAHAIRVAVFNGLPENDKPAFNETARMVWGIDFMSRESANKDYDFI